ncbi:hypothetical protein OUZ56_016700 [Daphnia magna]|uniref:Uncharacterized protein n=1 Tax=Daphnia magna TaxID=35525 RepID=A0ABR0ARA6_9CRUS|nr:hypothetical protein OUZ56_016700 [Daphnia magna]
MLTDEKSRMGLMLIYDFFVNSGVTQIGFRVEIFSPCLTRFYENNTAEKLFTLEKTTLFQNSQMFYNTPAGPFSRCEKQYSCSPATLQAAICSLTQPCLGGFNIG